MREKNRDPAPTFIISFCYQRESVFDQINEASPSQFRQQTRCMISHILPSLVRVHEARTNRMRGPESDQQAVQIQPFLTNHFLDRVFGGNSVQADGDPSKVFGLNGLERRDDRVNPRSSTQKHQTFEFRGLGEIKERRPSGYVHTCDR